MPPVVYDLSFCINLSDKIAVILQADKDSWEAIRTTAANLVNYLPAALEGLYFIGNPRKYTVITPRDFTENIPSWFHENYGKVELINPIFEQLEKSSFSGMVAIICTSPPIDLEDWVGTSLLERTVLINLGSRFQNISTREISGGLAPHLLASEFANPVIELWVTGDGFAPLCWKGDSGERFMNFYDNGMFSLGVYTGTERVEFHLKALGTEEPQLNIRRKCGGVISFKGRTELSWFENPEWKQIPDELKSVFTALSHGKPFRCAQCDCLHEPTTFLCPQGDVVMKGIPVDSLLIFCEDKYLTLSDWSAYPLCSNGVIVKSGGEIFNFTSNGWVQNGVLVGPERIDDGMWGVFHRI